MKHLAHITTYCAQPGIGAEYIADCNYTLGCTGPLGVVTGTSSNWGFSRCSAASRVIKKVECLHPNHTFIFTKEDL